MSPLRALLRAAPAALLSALLSAPVFAEEALPVVVPTPREVSYGETLFEIQGLQARIPEGMDPRIPAEVEALCSELGLPKDAPDGILLELALEGNGPSQGYHLRVEKERIVCTAPAPQGLFYGLQSLAQLCLRREGKVLTRPAGITDSPSYAVRGVICLGGGEEGLAFLKRHKFNLLMTTEARGKADPQSVGRTVDLCRRAFIDVLGLEGSQGSLVEMPDVEVYYRKRFDAGLRYLSVNFDDLQMAAGQGGDLARRHLEVALKARRALKDARLAFCPTPYAGTPEKGFTFCERQAALEYLAALRKDLPAEVEVFWTGPGVFSPVVDAASADAYAALIGRKPLFWDNMPIRWCNRFRMPTGRPADLCRHVSGTIANLNENETNDLVLSRPVWVALADSLWNSEGYVPDAAPERAFRALAGDAWKEAFAVWHSLAPGGAGAGTEEIRRAAAAVRERAPPGRFRDRLLEVLALPSSAAPK